MGDDESHQPPRHRKHEALGEQLPHDTPPAATDGRADRHLARSRGRPHEQQAGEVRTRDEQQHADRGRKQVEPLPQGECTPNTQLPNIRITQPGDGQQVQGQVQIVGAVVAPNFNRYQIEVASLNNPDSYTIIAGPITEQRQPGSTLATWDTTQVPNGLYRLRLAAFANDGGFVYRTVQVGVNNPLPTPTPDLPTAIPQAPTLAPDELGSPLPFNIQIIPATPQPTPEVPGL